MSPRSAEFMEQGRERLESARRELDARAFGPAVSLAYYAMLYAARAALSEEDRYARKHRGTWALFREVLVDSGRLPSELQADGVRIQELREAADYHAREPGEETAAETVATAERFVAAITELIGE